MINVILVNRNKNTKSLGESILTINDNTKIYVKQKLKQKWDKELGEYGKKKLRKWLITVKFPKLYKIEFLFKCVVEVYSPTSCLFSVCLNPISLTSFSNYMTHLESSKSNWSVMSSRLQFQRSENHRIFFRSDDYDLPCRQLKKLVKFMFFSA